jgi:hypothetical protein
MNSSLIRKLAIGIGSSLVILGLIYMVLLAVMMTSGSGFPPVEPFTSLFSVLILFSAILTVFYWVLLYSSISVEKKVFGLTSLIMIAIFSALTSINRFVALTVVKQSLASGNTNGLQWFLPYQWPSVMLALEILAWGEFFGLACLSLAPVFSNGKLERTIFWTLLIIGVLSLCAFFGQIINSTLLSFAGLIAWGPGFTLVSYLTTKWFHLNKNN